MSDVLLFLHNRPLPPQLAQAIKRQLPQIDLAELEDEIDIYLSLPMFLGSSESETKQRIARIAKSASTLFDEIQSLDALPRTSLDTFVRLQDEQFRLRRLRANLSALASGAVQFHADLDVPRGRPETIKATLVRNLVPIVERAGHKADSKPNGALVYLVTEVLQHCHGEAGSGDVRSLVRNTLAKSHRADG